MQVAQQLAPRGREAAALGGDADDCGRRTEASASSTEATIGTPPCVSPALVESSSATTGRCPYASTPRAVLP